jgi:predicted phage baseplate assembly protein
VVLHIPSQHVKASLGEQTAGWIQCRVVDARPDQPAYGSSPQVKGIESFTIGGTVEVLNAEPVGPEELGVSDGTAGQRFELLNKPVVRGDSPIVIEVAQQDGWQEWSKVRTFQDSKDQDQHFVLDEVDGVIEFGPAIREKEGGLRYYGAVPPAGSLIRVRKYYAGGGNQGNVAARTIKMLKSSIRYVKRVENRRHASGGTDAEDLENAKNRGPLLLRGTRAVAVQDYRYQAKDAAKLEIHRVECIEAGKEGGPEAGGVRVLIVPAVEPDEMSQIEFSLLHPLDEGLATRIRDFLDARRCVGARIVVEPPLYMGISVDAVIRAALRVDPKALEGKALKELYRYFSPLEGGPAGDGWPFGRPIAAGEVFGVLQQVKGVAYVEKAQLYRANPITGQRGDPVDRLDLKANALVFSFKHSVQVTTEVP